MKPRMNRCLVSYVCRADDVLLAGAMFAAAGFTVLRVDVHGKWSNVVAEGLMLREPEPDPIPVIFHGGGVHPLYRHGAGLHDKRLRPGRPLPAPTSRS
jgi:hypothetical protein